MRRINRPITDDTGRALLTIHKVEYKVVDDIKKMKKGLPPDQARYQAFDFTFEIDGLSGPFQIRERTGDVVKAEPMEEKYRGTVKVYNKITALVLGTGLATLEEIATKETAPEDEFQAWGDELKEKILGLEGTQWTGEILKVDAFHRVNFGTIKPLE